jgi:hypothetical protein
MWKTFLASVVTGLALLLAIRAPAAQKVERGQGTNDIAVRTVVLEGLLRHEKGALTRDPPIPFEYWKLHAGGETYYLDLRGKKLLELAERLVNRPVVVAGIPEPTSPTLRVTGLRADEFVKQTVHVEVRGRLVGVRLLEHLDWAPPQPLEPEPWPRPWPRPRPPIELDPTPIFGWRIAVGATEYALDLGGRSELLERANKLDGKGVVVTGTRSGDVIRVAGMEADEGTYRETVAVEIQGELSSTSLAELRPREEKCLMPKVGPIVWYVTANGQEHRLDFSNNAMPGARLDMLRGRVVVVTGTLKDGVVMVTALRPADPNDQRVPAIPAEKADRP